jgi:hypothetical protein
MERSIEKDINMAIGENLLAVIALEMIVSTILRSLPVLVIGNFQRSNRSNIQKKERRNSDISAL